MDMELVSNNAAVALTRETLRAKVGSYKEEYRQILSKY